MTFSGSFIFGFDFLSFFGALGKYRKHYAIQN